MKFLESIKFDQSPFDKEFKKTREKIKSLEKYHGTILQNKKNYIVDTIKKEYDLPEYVTFLHTGGDYINLSDIDLHMIEFYEKGLHSAGGNANNYTPVFKGFESNYKDKQWVAEHISCDTLKNYLIFMKDNNVSLNDNIIIIIRNTYNDNTLESTETIVWLLDNHGENVKLIDSNWKIPENIKKKYDYLFDSEELGLI